MPPGSKAALILIDLQRAIDHPSWGRRNNPDAEQNVAQLLSRWRATGRPVVHIRHVSRQPESTFRGEGLEFKAGAAPLPGEQVINKHTTSAFIGTSLEPWLRQHGIQELVITGVSTNISVESTARMAAELGFAAVVVSDATFTFGRVDFNGASRTAEEVHAMSLSNLQGEFATIQTTGQILSATR
jgi:nicotinamidase-related amidase